MAGSAQIRPGLNPLSVMQQLMARTQGGRPVTPLSPLDPKFLEEAMQSAPPLTQRPNPMQAALPQGKAATPVTPEVPSPQNPLSPVIRPGAPVQPVQEPSPVPSIPQAPPPSGPTGALGERFQAVQQGIQDGTMDAQGANYTTFGDGLMGYGATPIQRFIDAATTSVGGKTADATIEGLANTPVNTENWNKMLEESPEGNIEDRRGDPPLQAFWDKPMSQWDEDDYNDFMKASEQWREHKAGQPATGEGM